MKADFSPTNFALHGLMSGTLIEDLKDLEELVRSGKGIQLVETEPREEKDDEVE